MLDGKLEQEKIENLTSVYAEVIRQFPKAVAPHRALLDFLEGMA